MRSRIRPGLAVLSVAMAAAFAAPAAAQDCSGTWAILTGSQQISGATAQPLPAQSVDTTWVMRQTSGSGDLYGTWRLVRIVSEFLFLQPLPVVPPPSYYNTQVGAQVFACADTFTATSSVHACDWGVDYQVTPQGIFLGQVQVGSASPGLLTITEPGVPNMPSLTMTGTPAPIDGLVSLSATAQRNSANAPQAYRVFLTVHVRPGQLLSRVELVHFFSGVSQSPMQVNPDRASGTIVLTFAGLNGLPDHVLDQPMSLMVNMGDCRIARSITLRGILVP